MGGDGLRGQETAWSNSLESLWGKLGVTPVVSARKVAGGKQMTRRESRVQRARERSLSRTLTRALRHEPWTYGIELDGSGWGDAVAFAEHLRGMSKVWAWVTDESLADFFSRDSEQRFEYDEGRMRALYGHSIGGIQAGVAQAAGDSVPRYGPENGVWDFVGGAARDGTLMGASHIGRRLCNSRRREQITELGRACSECGGGVGSWACVLPSEPSCLADR